MISDFEETVDRFVVSLRHRDAGEPELFGYWRGRADEYAKQNDVNARRAYAEAQRRFARAPKRSLEAVQS